MNPNNMENQGSVGVRESVGASSTGDKVAQVKERATQLGRNAEESVNRGMHTAAEKLERTASSLRSSAPANNKVGDLANRAATGIEQAATYMRAHDVRDLVSDFEGAVRRNPGPSIAIAAAFGFLLGSALRSGKRSRY